MNNTGQNITAINVRASMPDASMGGGTTATLDLLVNGTVRQTITLSSQQSWGYEGNDHYNNESQSPADGNPRTFFDEVHTFLAGAALAPGDTAPAGSATIRDNRVINLNSGRTAFKNSSTGYTATLSGNNW